MSTFRSSNEYLRSFYSEAMNIKGIQTRQHHRRTVVGRREFSRQILVVVVINRRTVAESWLSYEFVLHNMCDKS